MKEWIGTTDVAIGEPTVVSIGKFDGEHRGHQKIFETMKKIAAESGYATAIFTFGTPPSALVQGQRRPQINTNAERRERLKQEGIDYVVEYPFTEKVRSLTGELFVKKVLMGQMNMRAIVAGPDCAFGKDKSGNAALLRKLGPELGFKTVIIEKETDGSREISSTYVREMLAAGDIEKANRLLGTTYALEGRVEHGNRIGGSLLGFPTVNLLVPENKLLPRYGVYETTVTLQDGRVFRGLTNVGDNPTVKKDRLNHRPRVETFLLDFSGNLYESVIRLDFLRFIRPEKTFPDLEALKEQIGKDLKEVRIPLTQP